MGMAIRLPLCPARPGQSCPDKTSGQEGQGAGARLSHFPDPCLCPRLQGTAGKNPLPFPSSLKTELSLHSFPSRLSWELTFP